MGCEGDEREEYFEGVMGVEHGKFEDELVEKLGTTIGTKFSVLHCIRIPLFDLVFDHWSTQKCIPVNRKAFQAIKM